MTDKQRPEFAKVLALLAQGFNEPISELRAEAYWVALRDLELPQLQSAALQAMQSLKFFPKPVELRDLILGNTSDRVEIAWTSWRNAARRLGGATSVAFRDAALAETLRQVFGGWPEACGCELTPEMWSAKRKEFERVYRLMLQKPWTEPHSLAGTHERNNIANTAWSRYTPYGIVDGDNATATNAEHFDRFLATGDMLLLKD